MAHPVVITKALSTAASDNNIATTQSLAAAGLLNLNGAVGTGSLGSQRRVILTSSGDDSGLTWTVVGTNDNGIVIKDSFAGANGVAQSNLDFASVASIFGSAATAANVKAGTNGVGSSPWVLFNAEITPPNTAFDLQLISGTGNVDVQYTSDEFIAPGNGPAIAYAPANPNPIAVGVTSMTGKAASAQANVTFPFRGCRLLINSGTGTWKLTITQAGIAGP